MTGFTDPPIAVSSNPIAQKDAAETFAESDVSLTHMQTAKSGESVGHYSGGDETIDFHNPQNIINLSGEYGVAIENTGKIDSISADLNANVSGATRVQAIRLSDDSVIASKTGSWSGGQTVTLSGLGLSIGESIRFVLDAEGASWDATRSDGGDTSQPRDTPLGDVTGWNGGMGSTSGYYSYVFDSVTLSGPSAANDGSVIVGFSEPKDIYRWDAATYTRTLDGEAVDVYIEANDGTGWSEVAGPIGRGDDIPAAPGDDVRFRVDISRTDTSNNPTLDSIYRRYVL